MVEKINKPQIFTNSIEVENDYHVRIKALLLIKERRYFFESVNFNYNR